MASELLLFKMVVVGGSRLYRESVKLALEAHNDEFHVTTKETVEDSIQYLKNGNDADVLLVNTFRYKGECCACIAGLADLRNAQPNVAVLLYCETDPCRHWHEAGEMAVAGLLAPTASVRHLIGVLTVIREGGTCFPANAFLNGSTPASRPCTLVSTLPGLTPRQREVFELMCAGQSNKAIGCSLEISESTVKAHISVILKILDVNTRTQAVLMASNSNTI